jgi:hypothetical protein
MQPWDAKVELGFFASRRPLQDDESKGFSGLMKS